MIKWMTTTSYFKILYVIPSDGVMYLLGITSFHCIRKYNSIKDIKKKHFNLMNYTLTDKLYVINVVNYIEKTQHNCIKYY